MLHQVFALWNLPLKKYR